MKKKFSTLLALMLSLSTLLVGCGSQETTSPADKPGVQTEQKADQKKEPVASTQPAEEITVGAPDGEALSTGPKGEEAASASSIKLTADEVKKVREGHYKAAIVMHYVGNDWSSAQLKGLEDTFKKLGIEVVATTDAQFKAEKQVADLESVLTKQPDIIVSIPVDATSTSAAYKAAAKAGAKLVFMDNLPANMERNEYVSVVSADNYGNGVASAEIMGEKLGGKGKIGVVFHDADYFTTRQRTEAFEKTIKDKFQGIEIAARSGITSPNDGEKVASAMLTSNPDLNGIYAVWDVPAEGVLAAVRSAGRDDLAITTIDLGANVALNIAQDGNIKGLGAQLPYHQGVTEAILGAYSVLGKEAPPYVALPPLKVTKENLLDAWKTVYSQDAPQEVQDAMKK